MIDTNVKSIVHPTDFSRASLNALAHALRIAVAAQGRLILFTSSPMPKRSGVAFRACAFCWALGG